MVLTIFPLDYTCPVVLRIPAIWNRFRLQGYYFCFRPVFQPCSAINSSNYAGPKPHRNKFLRFGLFRFRSPLLTKSLIYFLFPPGTKMFQFPGVPFSRTMCSCGDTVALPTVGFPIRKSADRGLFAAPRSLSQLVTSFFGAWCQGIHPMPLLALILYANLIRHIANVLVITQQNILVNR